jgi:hypothetical protein
VAPDAGDVTLTAHHHQVLERGDLADHRLGPVEQRRLDDEHPGLGVGELVAQVLALVGGVDRHRHRAGGHDPPPGQHRLGGVLDQGGHPITGLHPSWASAFGQATGGGVHLGGGELGAADVEVLAVGVVLEPPGHQAEHRLLGPADPHVVGHATPPHWSHRRG